MARNIPTFEGTVTLSRIDPGQERVTLLAIGLCFLGGTIPLGVLCMLPTPWNGLGWVIALAVVLSAVLGIIGLLVPIAMAEKSGKGQSPSPGPLTMQIGPAGITVPGVADVPWNEVLAMEGIPDQSTSIVIQTASHHKWLVQTRYSSEMECGLLPALQYHMHNRAGSSADVVARVKPFKRPAFYFFITLGYLLGCLVAGSILASGTSKGPLVALAVAIVLGALTAWLIWMPAHWSLGAYASKHGWTLQVDGHRLLCINRKRRHSVDLRQARWVVREAWGLTYRFPYLKLSAPGLRMCFAPVDDRWLELVAKMEDAKIPPFGGSSGSTSRPVVG